jgi:hypothetical protein
MCSAAVVTAIKAPLAALADGETVSFVARVYAYGRRRYVAFGIDKQGSNVQRSELELERVAQQRELFDLRGAPVALARSRFKLPDAKTEAGVRGVEMTRYLRDELFAYSMDRRRGLASGDNDFLFGADTGKRRDHNRSATESSAVRSTAPPPIARRAVCRRCQR